MTTVREIHIPSVDPSNLLPHLGPKGMTALQDSTGTFQRLGRRVWHVNSTAEGGGVAEMLRPLLGYGRGLGLDLRWLVLEDHSDFFEITKRVDNGISGVPGDGGVLGPEQKERYEGVASTAGPLLAGYIDVGDVVILHDPQTASLAVPLREAGATVVWRAHNGADHRNAFTRRAWEFLREYVSLADAIAVTRTHFAPEYPLLAAIHEIHPFIDPTSPKNRVLDTAEVHRLLQEAGILDDGNGQNGTARIIRNGKAPTPSEPTIVQVSRWDRVKDMHGVMDAFAQHIAPNSTAHLILIGPEVNGVVDDPEAEAYFSYCAESWSHLPSKVRNRIHLVCLPTNDPEANALWVNAAQRHATVVLQRSISEGFGLTLTEAMWKSAAVVASEVGGLALQISHGHSGFLVPPNDDVGLSTQTLALLGDPSMRARLGEAARESVRRKFLIDQHLINELRLITGPHAEVRK